MISRGIVLQGYFGLGREKTSSVYQDVFCGGVRV